MNRNRKNDDDDDDDDDCDISELRCDACTVPINKKSSDEGYMSCGKCKYFLHLACFNLPSLLPSHHLHRIEGHELILGSRPDKLSDWIYCYVCGDPTNGLSYECTVCDFRVDIKSASMPGSFKHAAHPQRRHYFKLVTETDSRSFCVACHRIIYEEARHYKCDNCRISMCLSCVLLPARNKHRLDNHVLLLTYDAPVNHVGEFYCNSCKEIMNPRCWMYHCRDCDQSFHPRCFPATSGDCRNINFGMQQYQVTHHALRFQITYGQKRCHVCHVKPYDSLGFQCTSCNFFMCFFNCYGRKAVQPMIN